MRIEGMPPVEAVIFDLGGVLIALDFETGFARTGELVELPPGEVRRRLFGLEAHGPDHPTLAFECGKLSEREFHAAVEKLFDHPIPYASFVEVWNSIFPHEIEATVALALELDNRPGLKVGILSNTNALHLEHLRGRMHILRKLRHVYASHQMRCRKPEAAAFRHVLQKMKVAPERAVMVDDMAENIAAAQALGMQTVHATDPAAVRGGLAMLGVV